MILMYICICNAIKDKHIDSIVTEGASCAGDVFERMGCKPVCGKCIPEIKDSLQGARANCVSE